MRMPAVAGQFYPSNPKDLKMAIEESYLHPIGPGKIPSLNTIRLGKVLGGIVPHAGYFYSGPVAAHFYSELAKDGYPETFIIIGPNHTGIGSAISATTEDYYTPFGRVKIDEELNRRIIRDIVDVSKEAHAFEHSIEVQLPFLQYLKHDIKIVPIVMLSQYYEFAKILSGIIKDAINDYNAVLIASSDFSHYVPKEVAYRNDLIAIEKLLNKDVKSFYEYVESGEVTACGYGPIATAIMALNGNPRLLKYATSGDIVKMKDVVGYASIVIER
jgi:AmmeMemoRadiSam system protein B